jgi:hypothetical protein
MKASCFTFICVFAIGAVVAPWHFAERKAVLGGRSFDYKERLGPREKTKFSRLKDRELKTAVEDYRRRLHAFGKLRDSALNKQKQLENVLPLYDSKFNSEYLTEGRALSQEMLDRIEDSREPKDISSGRLILMAGSLVGANPIDSVLAYMKQLVLLL